jgi:hypothetical protein
MEDRLHPGGYARTPRTAECPRTWRPGKNPADRGVPADMATGSTAPPLAVKYHTGRALAISAAGEAAHARSRDPW